MATSLQSMNSDFKGFVKGTQFRLGDEAKVYEEKLTDWDYLNKQREMLRDSSYRLTNEEISAIESQILHNLTFPLVSPGLITTKDIGKGLRKWKFNTWGAVQPPRYTMDFSRGDNVQTAKTETEVKLMGMDYDYSLTMPEVDVYNNSNRLMKFSETLEQGILGELVQSLGKYREYYIFRGSSIPNMNDIGQKGLVNASGITDPGAMGEDSDDNLTTAGDIQISAIKMANELIQSKFEPPFQLHMTPGVYTQALKNRNTTTKETDFQLLAQLGVKEIGRAFFDRIVLNPYLIGSETETNTTGAMACFKPGPENFRIIESYPLGYYPMPSIDLGIEGKLLWMGGVEVRRPSSIVYADALTINTLDA